MNSALVLDPFDRNPLLSQSIWLYKSADEWIAYVEGLYDETKGKKGKKKKKPPVPASCSKTKKGSVVFRIRRDPKFITTEEAKLFSKQLELEPADLERLLIKRKIEIRNEKETKDASSKLSGAPDK